MPGILDYNKVLGGFGPYSTSEFRKSLLSRNLPPPITQTIIDGGLTSYLEDLNKIISFPDNIAGENISSHYDINTTLFPLGEFYRDTQNVNLNSYTPENDNYLPFEVTIPSNLGSPIPSWGGERERISYPLSYNEDNFELINKGDKKGIQYPYSVVNIYRNLDLNKESSLGLVGGDSLKQNLIDKVSQVEMSVIKPITFDLHSKDNMINWMNGSQQFFKTLPNDAIGWQEYNVIGGENNINPSLSTEQRMGSLLSMTNDLQVGLFLNSINKNKYIPFYSDKRVNGTGEDGTNPNYYVGNERTTNGGSTIATNFSSSDFNSEDGPDAQKVTTVDENYFWNTGNQTTFNEKTLLYKTQKLVDENPDGVWINQTKKYFKDKNQDRLISRGNAISNLSIIEASVNGAFCRVWTVNDNYNYLNAIRNTGLFSAPDPSIPGFSVTKSKSSLSVLMDNGIPKYHPVADDSTTTFKKYMFSLENLAWSDNLADLPLSEIGPGDLLTGNKGRIMWFPPYDLSFDESVSANWQKNDFLGRSEPVFTYNNTTRSGSLKFKVLVDHPRVINGYRGKRTDAIERFFAGCITPSDFLEMLDKNAGLSESQKNEINLKFNEVAEQKADGTSLSLSESFSVCWLEATPDDITTGISTCVGSSGIDPNSNNSVIYNAGEVVKKILSQKQKAIIVIESFQGAAEPKNTDKERSKVLKTAFKDYFNTLNIKQSSYSIKVKNNGNSLSSGLGTASSNAKTPASDRRSEITVSSNLLENSGDDQSNPFASKGSENLKDIAYYPQDAQLIDSLIIDETKYFDYVDGNYPNYFSSISEKIKYFHPGFHSTTPEGLNTRLTFLQQCMRQGPSIYDDRETIQAQNLAFGRPPICILRIGDFFHTKVAINSLNITYEAGSSIQWDLNPEGIGVQPMMANVTMSLDIIGGQSLISPINRLQNALSFNFYANTEMYDMRSDTVDKSSGTIVDGVKLGKLKQNAGVDIDKLEESLKKEGIKDGLKDSQQSGDNTEVPSKGDIKISSKDKDILISNAISATTENQVRILIGKEEKNNFKEVVNSLSSEKESKYLMSTHIKDWEKDDEKIAALEIDIEKAKTIIIQNNQAISGTSANVSAILKDNEKQEREIEKSNKKLTRLREKPNELRVTVYYEKDEKSTTKKKIFKYRDKKIESS